jgi:hypothetical protein
MASGFLVLPDGRCFSVRWALHDAVLQTVAEQLGQEPETQQFGRWLLGQSPGPTDIELGYAWVRARDKSQVVRSIDLRRVTAANQLLFLEAVKRANLAGSPDPVLRRCLASLAEKFACWERGEPSLSNSDWDAVLPVEGGPIGPGWSDQ